MTKFNDMAEVTSYITSALGEFAEDFDVNAMASDCTEWKDGKLVFTFDEEAPGEFFAIAAKYDKSN